uniref:Odorant binding protein 15 n=1 Tax=Colaphellus bowringi TaxID=561076 RepID=A0A0S3J2I8_9CUCU|nr:odorant binding protein 15 [Colaphellus bowringi]
MKSIIVCFVAVAFLALAFAEETEKEKMKRIHEECQSDPATKVEESVLKAAEEGDVDVTKIGPHTLCMNVKVGLQKENGDIVKDELRAGLRRVPGVDESKIESIVEECGQREGGTAEEAAIKLFQCLQKRSKITHHHHHHE